MIRGRAISIAALSTRQCMYQVHPQARIAPFIRPTMQLQRGMSEQSWVQKITNFFYGKDEEASATKLAKDVKEVVDTAKELTLQQYFKHMDKFQTMKKIGLGNALEKLVGVNLDTAQEKLVENHKKIKEFLTELELQGTNFSLSPQRKSELQSSTGLTAQEIDQISNLFAHIKQVKQAFDKAKSDGKIPQSLDELKQMIGGAFNAVTSAAQGTTWPPGQQQGEQQQQQQQQGEQKEGEGKQQEYRYTGQREGMRGKESMAENLGKEGETQTGSPFNTQRGSYGTSFGTAGSSSPYGSVGTAYPETQSSTTYTESKVAPTQGESQNQQGQSFPSGFKEGFKQTYGTAGGYSAHEKDYSKAGETKSEWKNENMSDKKDWKSENKNEWKNENMSDKKDWKNENMSDKKDWKSENKNEWKNENMSDKKDWKNENMSDKKDWKSENKNEWKNENISNKSYGDQNVTYGTEKDVGYGPSSTKENKNTFGDDDIGGGFKVTDPEKKPFIDEKKNTYESTSERYPSSSNSGPSPAGTVGGQSGNPFTQNQTTQTRKFAQSAVKPQPQTGAHRGSPVSNPEAHQKRVVGKDEVVRITNGMEIQEMSFEKAEPFISSGKWSIIESTKL